MTMRLYVTVVKTAHTNAQWTFEIPLKPDTMKEVLIKSCDDCGSEFISTSTVHRFCSKACKRKFEIKAKSAASKKPKQSRCMVCGKEFSPYTSLDRYCSSACRIENMKSGRSSRWSKESILKRMGENNPAYKHGLRVNQGRPSADGLKRFFRNRDEYRQDIINNHGYLFCERCGETGGKFEAHHIIFRSEKPGHPKLHDKENILNLCVKCHNWYHISKGNRNAIVIARGLDQIFGNDILDK